MEEQRELPSKLESDKTKSSKPSLRETIRPAVERVSNDSSGRATEPSKYRTTCLLPHATSSKNAPKENTSELVVALPVLTGSQPVDINSNMVVIDIIEFPILEGIKLNRHHMVRRIAIGGVIEKAEIRVGKCPRKASRGRDGEGKAVGEQTRVLGHHSTDKSGGEGESRGVGGILESDRHGAQIGRPESVECELQVSRRSRGAWMSSKDGY
nr:hypothetical protein Iba_chr05bCG5000 [Ipomoea batatas]